MQIWMVVGEILYILVLFSLFFFSISSLYEKERRGFRNAVLVLGILLAVWIVLHTAGQGIRSTGFFLATLVGVGFCILVLLGPRPREEIRLTGIPEKVDERDIIFARFDLKPGSEHFEQYYAVRHKYRAGDDEIRTLPDVLHPEHFRKDPVLFAAVDAQFNHEARQVSHVDGAVTASRFEQSPSENARMVKNILGYLGADLSGVCELDQAYVYSHVGRGPVPYGSSVKNRHRFAVSFAVAMDYHLIASSPKAPVLLETAKYYTRCADYSVILAEMIRRLGYSARAHIAGSNYQAVLPPLAWKAGLGELGRLGILITEKFGPRVRLGLVTTDFPMTIDHPRSFGVQNFCLKCRKCAINCPSQAIPVGDKIEENRIVRWTINREKCYRYWRITGTDCARCIYVCPYSKPDNLVHRGVRFLSSTSTPVQILLAKGDDFFYGKHPRPREVPLNFRFDGNERF